MYNPIPFNVELLTVRQLKECAEILSRAFDGITRGVSDDNIVHNLKQEMEQFQKNFI